VEVFSVEVARGSWPDGARLREDLDEVLSDRMVLADRLAAKAADYASTQRLNAARPVVPKVLVDNEASATSTVIEVDALDEVGLLHRVTKTLFDCDLDVASARVSTVGREVVDAFYVRDATGAKVTDAHALEHLHKALLAAIS
jgi:[protein-PII] uridylyltransferase